VDKVIYDETKLASMHDFKVFVNHVLYLAVITHVGYFGSRSSA